MELFPASDTEKWGLIKGVIDDSDYYLLIIGGRYGSIDSKTDLSYTEMEFDYAVETKTPVMAFLHGNPGAIAADKSELSPEAREKLDTFRAKVEKRMVRYWTTTGDLDGSVAKSIIKIRKESPAEGWVRGRYAMTPEQERDIAELRAKVSELTRALETARTSKPSRTVEGLAEGDDRYELSTNLVYLRKNDAQTTEYRRQQHRQTLSPMPTWNETLFHVGPSLLDECDESDISSELETVAAETILEQELIPEDFDKEIELKVKDTSTKDVIVQLFALGLIEHGVKRRQISDTSKYWKLTELGRDQLMVLRAQKKPNATPDQKEQL